jgi:PTS system mannose-specific IIC component
MSGPDIAVVAILGAVLGLDVVSFPQAMISRPIVACTLVAGVLGRPDLGLLLGAIVECFALETLPVGASRYPEWGSSSAVGGALVARTSGDADAVVASAVIGTLALAWFGGWSMVQVRRLNASLARARHAAVARGSRRVVNGLQLYGMTADLIRGALVALVGLLIAMPLAARLAAPWSVAGVPGRVYVVTSAAIVAGAAVWKVLRGTRFAAVYFAVGLAIGIMRLATR